MTTYWMPRIQMPVRQRHRGPRRAPMMLGALLAVHLCASPAHALDPSKAVTQYRHDAWETDDGLPQNSVQAIAQTPDGYLWLGTQEGLVRFDGVHFAVFDKSSVAEMKSNLIWTLLVDKDGALWVGTQRGVVKHDKGVFNAVRSVDGTSEASVKTLCQGPDGSIWIGTEGHGLTRLLRTTATTLTTRNGLLDNTINALLAGLDGSIYVATPAGLNVFKDGNLTTLAINMAVSALARDGQGRVWIATAAGNLARCEGGVIIKEPRPTNKEIWSLIEDRDGCLWIASGGDGLIRARRSGGYSAWTARDGLTDDFIQVVFEDREGNLWIGASAGGLNRLTDSKFTVYTTSEGLSSKTVTSVCEDKLGNIWLGTDGGGLNRISDDRIVRFDSRNGLLNDAVMSVFPSRDGGVWVGTNDGGLNRVSDDGSVSSVDGKDLRRRSVFALCEDHSGDLWIGTYGNGLLRYSHGRFDTYTVDKGLSNENVISLCEGATGCMWIGTSGGGLNCLKNGRFTAYTMVAGLTSDSVTALYEDTSQNLWIGTYGGGLNRLTNGKLTAWTTKQGLFDDVVFQILEDSAGNLWMTSNRGVFRVSKKELDASSQGKIRRISCVSYGEADGLRSIECSGGTQPAGWKDRRGRLWFPTLAGAVMIDPANIPANSLPPLIEIEEVRVDTRDLPLPRPGQPFALPPGRGRFEFHYTALSLQAPENVRFMYMLEGYDETWVDAGVRRVAYYTNIPPGHYAFKVKACNNDGVWNERGVSFELSLRPHFYESGWFYSFCALAALTGAAGIHRLRVRHLVERQRELRVLVDKQTIELRSSNEQLKASNEDLQQLNEHLQKAYEDIRRAEEEMARLSEPAGGMLEEMAERAGPIANDVARMIGAREIGVWAIENGKFVRLGGTSTGEPDWDSFHASLNAKDVTLTGGRVIVPALGMTGEAQGGLVIHGEVAWAEGTQTLVRGFARYLGTALEFRRLRKQLAAAETHRPVSQKEIHDRGIATLSLCPTCKRCYGNDTDRCPVDGSGLDEHGLLPFKIHDRYQLVRLLGEGGMGTVFRARDEKLLRDVAIKIVRAEQLNDPVARFRLEREARTIARIRHPGVIAIYDTGDLYDGSTFLVTELLRGRDLAHVLRNHGPGTLRQAARLIRLSGAAVTAAHRFGVIHRDLKPANLFIIPEEEDFQVTVLDFGLAKSERIDADLTKSGLLVGTPAYMSPEQVRGQRVDQRSDLYSLAAVAYEVITGRRVVMANDLAAALAQALHAVPPPLSTLLPGIPASVDSAFAAALAMSPEDRPESVGSWVTSFVDVLESAETSVSRAAGWPDEVVSARESEGATPDPGAERTVPIGRGNP